MNGRTRLWATGGGIALAVSVSTLAAAQTTAGLVTARSSERSGGASALSAVAALGGTVTDQAGLAVTGVVVSAIGPTVTVSTQTDVRGHYEFRGLPPGRYFVHVNATGFSAPAPRVADVRQGAVVSLPLAVVRSPRRPESAATGLGLPVGVDLAAAEPASTDGRDAPRDASVSEPSETAWRLRHARRSILKDTTLARLGEGQRRDLLRPVDYAHLATGAVRLASDLLVDSPLSGQVNFLTTGSLTTPSTMFSESAMSRGITFLSLSAPAGEAGIWTVRGAMTRADVSSWVVAGDYVGGPQASRPRRLGLSYSTQRYEGGNPLALREVTDGSRNVGEIFGYETRSFGSAVAVTYGGRWAQYDYLTDRTFFSPRVELAVTPLDKLRIRASVSRRGLAPGAEEFLPPDESGILLPPQRTFSAIESGRPLSAERTLDATLGVERGFRTATVAIRMFHQQTDDQLMTLFGVEKPDEASATLGHYFSGDVGDAKATGGAASIKTSVGSRVRAKVEYSLATARLRVADSLRYVVLIPPSLAQPRAEHLHDVSAKIEADVPETATRVVVVYRVGNAFVKASSAGETIAATRRALDSRFDIQVRQSLPFMDFGTARWEMLVALRNFFHENGRTQSLYDELLVVRPPTRVVGGLTMLF